MSFPPVLLFGVSCIIVSITASYTKNGSPIRYLSLTVLLYISWILPKSIESHSDSRGWASRLPAGAGLWNAVTLFDRLIHRGWDFEIYSSRTEEAVKEEGKSLRGVKSRTEFGAAVSSEARGIDTFWEVKYVPNFAREDPSFVPERWYFASQHVLVTVACYYAHNWAISKMLDLNPQLLGAAYIPFLTRLSDIKSEEVRTRSLATGAYWLAQFANMQFFYSIVSALIALANPQEIKLFRPLFGSPGYAYSVRNAWGKTWHQSLRSGLEGTSAFLAHDVLQMPRSGTIQRYSKILFSFGVSGLMHIFADAGGGVPMRSSGALQFFSIQALGIVIEDAFQASWRRIVGQGRFAGVARLAGFAWVVGFFIWTSPVWIYPVILAMRQEDAVISFESIKTVVLGRSGQ